MLWWCSPTHPNSNCCCSAPLSFSGSVLLHISSELVSFTSLFLLHDTHCNIHHSFLFFCLFFTFSPSHSLTSHISTSVRELLLDNAPGFTPRVCGVDFKEYGGKCKAIWTGNDPTHYRKILTNADMPEILSSYSTNLTRLATSSDLLFPPFLL